MKNLNETQQLENELIQRLEKKLKNIDDYYADQIERMKAKWSEAYNNTAETIEILKSK